MIPPYFQLNRFLKVFISSNFIVDRGIYTLPKKNQTKGDDFMNALLTCTCILYAHFRF